ncbi:MAG: YdcF family protein [Alphaproteobacteria bacterium]
MVSMRGQPAENPVSQMDPTAPDRTRWRALWLVLLGLGIVLAGLLLGLIAFAIHIERLSPPDNVSADALVVLTGSHQRIETGIALMRQGAAPRLLISGVNGQGSADIVRHFVGHDELVSCCIDFGLEALTTFGNAREASKWAGGKDIQTLVVITSDYHLPRAIVHFSRAFPDIALIPHPVESTLPVTTWYRYRSNTMLLIEEFLKFLLVSTGVSRLYEPE